MPENLHARLLNGKFDLSDTLTVTMLCISVFACLGFLSPANRGALMTCVLVLYVCLGTPAGYISARIYKSETCIQCLGKPQQSTLMISTLKIQPHLICNLVVGVLCTVHVRLEL